MNLEPLMVCLAVHGDRVCRREPGREPYGLAFGTVVGVGYDVDEDGTHTISSVSVCWDGENCVSYPDNAGVFHVPEEIRLRMAMAAAAAPAVEDTLDGIYNIAP